MQQIKTMPANIEAEKALLGCILLDENLMVEAIDSLSVDDFYDSKNKVIFSAMSNLKDNNLKIDITTLLSELEKNNKLELAGGYPYLGSLADYGYSISNFESYIDLIQNSALRRETINVLGRLQQEGFDLNVNTFDYVENVERDVFQLSRRRRVDGFSTIKEVSERVIKQTEKASKNKELLVGLTTGFHSLDNITLGFQSHQLIILAARPGMGKSALALNLAVNIATKNKGGNASVAIFNLEMSGEQLAMRMLAADSKIGLKQIQTGALKYLTGNFATQLLKALKIDKQKKNLELSCAVVRADIGNGKATFPKGIVFNGSKLRLVGSGDINLVNDQMSFTIAPTLNKLADGNIAQALASFVKLEGTLEEPKIGLDTRAALTTVVGTMASGGAYLGSEVLLSGDDSPCYTALQGTSYAAKFPKPSGVKAATKDAYQDVNQTAKDTMKGLENAAKNLFGAFTDSLRKENR